jgi:transposase InsO family protein
MACHLRREGHLVGRKRIRRLMAKMGLAPIYQRPKTSVPHPEHPIERFWRSLKYECIYLYAFETGSELRAGLARWIGYYNARRPHSALAGCLTRHTEQPRSTD